MLVAYYFGELWCTSALVIFAWHELSDRFMGVISVRCSFL